MSFLERYGKSKLVLNLTPLLPKNIDCSARPLDAPGAMLTYITTNGPQLRSGKSCLVTTAQLKKKDYRHVSA
jgi:hypothetical protein